MGALGLGLALRARGVAAATGASTIDFTVEAASYGGVTPTNTGTTYLVAGGVPVPHTSATDPLWEDRGDGAGGGVWVFPSTTNLALSAFDFSATPGWSNYHVTVTAAAALGPDGVTMAQKLIGSGGGQVYAAITPQATSVSAWYRDSATPPTAPPAFEQQAGGVTQEFVSGAVTTWTRFLYYFSTGAEQSATGIAPSIGTYGTGDYTVAGTGGGYFWGYSCYPGPHDLPLIPTTASAAKTLTSAWSGTIVSGVGDLDLEVGFVMSASAEGLEGDFYLWSFTTPDGLASLHYAAAAEEWVLTVRGVAVLSPLVPVCWAAGQAVIVRAWYQPSRNAAGIRVTVMGCFVEDATTTTTGSARAPAATVYLATNMGSATSAFSGRLTRVHRSPAAPSTVPVEWVFVGDSIFGAFGGGEGSFNYSAVAATVYTLAESRTRPGIASLAQAGDKIADQLTIWQASPWRHAASVTAVCIQIGINDVAAGTSAAAITSALQGLVNQIASDVPGAAIVIGEMLPCQAYLLATYGATAGAAMQVVWSSVNANIAGTGGAPITGVAARVLGGEGGSPLNDGTDNLPTAYASGSPALHTNQAGRVENGVLFRAALHGLGLV
jgi:lysophospholipase L1-like esterase